jgi:hypothetical protein
LLCFTGRVFIGSEVRLDIGFGAAQARLTNLARSGLLRCASDDAYHEWGTGVARVGPLAAASGMSKLVRVRFRDMVIHGDSALWALRWEATGLSGALFPALDADIMLTPDGEDATVLAVSGVYRPPLGGLGAGVDRAVLHRIAQATMRTFVDEIGAAITHPDPSSVTGRTGLLPEAPPWPSPETP